MAQPVDPIVAIPVEPVLLELGYLCQGPSHPDNDTTPALYRLWKPETSPPIEGPDRIYVCENCLWEFLALCGVKALIL